MFDVNSREKEAHHQVLYHLSPLRIQNEPLILSAQFMSLSPDEQTQVSNQALFGQAAAYHVCCD